MAAAARDAPASRTTDDPGGRTTSTPVPGLTWTRSFSTTNYAGCRARSSGSAPTCSPSSRTQRSSLLDAADLTGASADRWSGARRELAGLFESYASLRTVVDRATTLRGGRRTAPAELAALLHGPVHRRHRCAASCSRTGPARRLPPPPALHARRAARPDGHNVRRDQRRRRRRSPSLGRWPRLACGRARERLSSLDEQAPRRHRRNARRHRGTISDRSPVRRRAIVRRARRATDNDRGRARPAPRRAGGLGHPTRCGARAAGSRPRRDRRPRRRSRRRCGEGSHWRDAGSWVLRR